MGLLETQYWPARWQCGTWTAELGWLHIAADTMIFAAYAAIPVLLLYFVKKRPDVPMSRVFVLFSLFVLACGIGHLIEAIMFWHPVYRLSGVWKAGTAVISWITVIAMIPAMPAALRLPGLAKVNAQLQREIETREKVEALRQESLEKLRQSEERFALALEGASDGLWDWDLDEDVIFYSPRFRSIVGDVTTEPLTASPDYWLSRIHPLDRKAVETALSDHLDGNAKRFQCEHRIQLPGGERRWVVIRGSAVLDNDGRARRLVGGLIDVHRIKTAHEGIISHVSHELRTPLAAIHQFASNLADDIHGGMTDDQRMVTEGITRNAAEMGQLIDRVVEAARLGDGRFRIEPHAWQLSETLQECVDRVGKTAKGLGISLRVEAAEDEPQVFCDPGAMQQVVTNLLDNALKFSPNGGEVVLAIDGWDARTLEFSISDTGSGIAPEDLEHIFNRLRQGTSDPALSRRGLGLGLFIVREILRSHGGSIWVESEPGEGTTFHVTLPVFNLDAILEPATDYARDHNVPISIISLTVRPGQSSFVLNTDDPEFQMGLQAIRDLLFPGRDVLLPVWCSGEGDRALITLVVATNQPGCQALRERLTRQLEQHWTDGVVRLEWQVVVTSGPEELKEVADRLQEVFRGAEPPQHISELMAPTAS